MAALPADCPDALSAEAPPAPASLAAPSSAAPSSPMPAELHVERIRSNAELAGLCVPWNRIAGDSPFCQWEWLEAWWRHFQETGDELFVLAVRDAAGELVGLAPWYVARSILFGRTVRFLGSGMVCSDYLTILSAPGREEQVIARLADWLNGEGRRLWHALELSGVATNDPAVSKLIGLLREQGNPIESREGLSCWRLQLPADWDVYVAGLSKSRRERVRQLVRRQFDTGRAVLHSVRGEDNLERGMTVLRELHQLRRTAVNGYGCFDNPRFAAFLQEAAERFLRLGRLRLQWIELEGRPVATEFDLTGGDTVYYYQSGFDPAAADERPGWLGTIGALRWAIADGYRCFDFLRGDETYKSHWRSEPCPLLEWRVAARQARMRHRMWRAKEAAKTLIRRCRKLVRREPQT